MTEPINPIQPTGGINPTPEQGKSRPADSAEFRRILERLQAISNGDNEAKTKQLDDTQEFLDAMKKADDQYLSVMDLRQKLEDAYKKGRP
jgi:hypothetical protein